jgi:hypothetical protein
MAPHRAGRDLEEATVASTTSLSVGERQILARVSRLIGGPERELRFKRVHARGHEGGTGQGPAARQAAQAERAERLARRRRGRSGRGQQSAELGEDLEVDAVVIEREARGPAGGPPRVARIASVAEERERGRQWAR